MRLLVQPRDGISPLVSAIRQAKKHIDLMIFRFDRSELQKELETAVKRGVRVRALIAHTNRGGEANLRKLEQQLLEVGATVARTGDEFVRYHGKFMVIDRSALWLLGFNFTALDVKSRSFGIVTKQKSVVQEALKVFEADTVRQPFEPTAGALVVSPENARMLLSKFISDARQQLLIYDPKIGDPAIIKLLKNRAKEGLDLRVIGKVGKRASDLSHEKYPGKRMHVRAIVRDGREAFVGSQSLRKLELEKRREVGFIFRDASAVAELIKTFEDDWALTDAGKKSKDKDKSESDGAERQREARAEA